MFRYFILSIVFLTCASTPAETEEALAPITDKDFNTYWFSGEAEISSYSLSQARYGEIHEGHSVLVYVTEPFNPLKYVKSDYGSDSDVQVLKLNNTKKFNTGIYPYSMMTSTFLPVEAAEHSLKVSSTSQEWCGHTFMQLENREQFDISIESYFEGESSEFSLAKTLLEDDIWTKIRLNPEALPTGDLKMIPSFFYLRLKHKETKSYSCSADLSTNENSSTYTLDYEGLKRKLSIEFENEFPYRILNWQESNPDGRGTLTTEANLMKSMKSAYWGKNAVKDSGLRKELNLD